LHVIDASRGWTEDDDVILKGILPYAVIESSDEEEGGLQTPPMMLLMNKSDLTNDDDETMIRGIPNGVKKFFSSVIPTSANTGSGMDKLHDGLLELVGAVRAAVCGSASSCRSMIFSPAAALLSPHTSRSIYGGGAET
jgi:50S ribosomal subunit-associated GTPase HflX